MSDFTTGSLKGAGDPAHASTGYKALLFTGSALCVFYEAAITLFSLFSAAIATERGWELTFLLPAYSLSLLFSCASSVAAGGYADRHGTRHLMFAGGFLCAAAWIVVAWSPSVWVFYLGLSVMLGIGQAMLYTPFLTTTQKYFPGRRGLVAGVLLVFAPLCTIVLSPAFSWGFQKIGIFPTLAAYAACGVLLPVIFGAFQPVYDTKADSSATANGTGLSTVQMLHRPAFYALLALMLTMCCGGQVMYGTLYSIARQGVGLDAIAAAFAISIGTTTNLAARVPLGIMYDRLGGTVSVFASLTIETLALFFLSFAGADSPYMFYACTLGLGYSYAAAMVLFPMLTRDLFGPRCASQNYGVVYLGNSLMSFLAPQIMMRGYAATGSFAWSFRTVTLIAASGFVYLWCISRSKTRY